MKSTPTVPAASSIARATWTTSPRRPSVMSETGVMEIRLFATLIPNCSPISSTVGTSRAATARTLSPAFCATPDIESLVQSSRLRPRVTVRTSRCSISVIATVCRISAWVYSIRLADDFAENQEHEEDDEHAGGDENEAETRVVRCLIDHDAGGVTGFFDGVARS